LAGGVDAGEVLAGNEEAPVSVHDETAANTPWVKCRTKKIHQKRGRESMLLRPRHFVLVVCMLQCLHETQANINITFANNFFLQPKKAGTFPAAW
jgi:hypothetical protein